MTNRYHVGIHNMKTHPAFNLQRRLVRGVVLGVFCALVGFTPLEGAESSPDAGYSLAKGTNEFGV